MKYNPFKILLWILFLVFILVNSLRLFIYGFIISFIVVIIDRIFFDTRKRSDKQFLYLFFTFTSIFGFFYTFSPYFRSVEFTVSHPKWNELKVVSIEKLNTEYVYSTTGFLEKVYTNLKVTYEDEKGIEQTKNEEIKHYAMFGFEPFFKQKTIVTELDYIHNRSLQKILQKKAIHLFQHPSKDKMKIFKGDDAFALRHSIGSQIAVIISYILFFILTIFCLYNFKKLRAYAVSNENNERQTIGFIFVILFIAYLIVGINIIHYLKFA